MPIAIAGMPRSGTSMVAKLLHLGGLYLGREEDLEPAAPDNVDGFWENVRFVEINDAVLSSLGAGWDRPPRPAAWDEWDAAVARTAPAARVLLAEFEEHEPWGWKDPRTSLTLP